MSICSKHQIKDSECPACNITLDIPEPDCELVTCKCCNFVFYAYCDICPKCNIEV